MKTTKRAKTVDSVAAGNIHPAIPPALARTDFLNRVGKSKDGANTYVEKFLSVMDAATNLQASFSLSTVAYLAQPYEIPISETKRLFAAWCETMLRLHKISIVEGCMDEPLIVLV